MYDGLGITSIEILPLEPAVVLKTKPFRTIAEIKEAVAKRYRISLADMDGPCRRQCFAHPRQIAMALSYKRLKRHGYSLPMIGRHFGGRDHTTVLYACRKFGMCANKEISARAALAAQRRARRVIEGWA